MTVAGFCVALTVVDVAFTDVDDCIVGLGFGLLAFVGFEVTDGLATTVEVVFVGFCVGVDCFTLVGLVGVEIFSVDVMIGRSVFGEVT